MGKITWQRRLAPCTLRVALVYEKRVGIYGKHEQGIIRIKPYYWEDGVEISWKQAMD